MKTHKNAGAQAILRILQTKDNNIMSNKPKANNKGHLQKKLPRPRDHSRIQLCAINRSH